MNMNIVYLIGNIFIGILLFILYILLTNLIINMSDYFAKKRDLIHYEINRPKEVTLGRKMDVTNELLKMIDDMIMTEFGGVLHRFAILGEIYPTIRIDNDVKEVATIVFSAFNPDTFKDLELCVTEEYLMKYITERSKTLALNAVYEYNTALQGKKSLVEALLENDEEG